MDQTIKIKSFVIGLIGAITLAAITIYIWQTQSYTNLTLGLTRLILPIPFGILAQWISKRSLDGFISLKQAVLAFFVCMLVIFAIDMITNYLIYVQIDPQAYELSQQATEQFDQRNDNALASQDEFTTPEASLQNFFIGFATQLLFYTIFGIITALAFRKDRP